MAGNKILKLAGVIAAIPTPLTDAGEPDCTRFLAHARWLMANGCDGLNVLGTTGEANSLSFRQRISVMSCAAQGQDPSAMIVGTGVPDLETTIGLTREAEGIGFAGALILPPYYYKDVSQEGLFAWFAAVVEATSAIPVLIYNFPKMAGVGVTPDLLDRLQRAFPDRIAGAKDSSGDPANAAAYAENSALSIFPGSEALLIDANRPRFVGCISATASITAPHIARFFADPGDENRKKIMVDAREAIARFPLVPAVKHLISLLHGDPEFDRVLPPLMPLDAPAREALAGIFSELISPKNQEVQ